MVRQLHAHEGATRGPCLLNTNASQTQMKDNIHVNTYIPQHMDGIVFLFIVYLQPKRWGEM